MKVYHEAASNVVGSILEKGIKKEARGAKGDDIAIIEADAFLDSHRPQELIAQGVKRDDNIYAYLREGDTVVDITDGTRVPFHQFVERSTQKILELEVNPAACYVSDLDTFDAVKMALEEHQNQQVVDQLAKSYWSKVRRLSDYTPDEIRRPEIMITYDIAPIRIRLVSAT